MTETNHMTVAEAKRLCRFRDEKQFQAAVDGYLKVNGWLSYHTHDSRRSQAGFPDICAIHPGRGVLLFAELKMPGNKPSKKQQAWLEALKRFAALHEPPERWRPERCPAPGASLVPERRGGDHPHTRRKDPAMLGAAEDYSWSVESFGAHLERSGWKQLALAAATGVLQQTISRLKQGQDYMSEDAASRLAPKFFHTTTADLRLAHNLYVFHRRHESGDLSPLRPGDHLRRHAPRSHLRAARRRKGRSPRRDA